jgi:subtilisin family serine protease
MNDPVVGLPPDLVRFEGSQILAEETWHLPRSVYRDVRKVSTGRGVRVAVLDTGYYAHTTLPKPLATKSFISGENVQDGNGHGTHCAGTILSRDEDIGLASEAELVVGKVLSNGGSGSSSGIADGVEWAISLGVDIISMSLGGGSSYTPTNTAIKKALSRGIIVCLAAGNSGFSGSTNTIGWPARSGEGVCVAAIRKDGQPATFSSGGVQMTIAAPGEQILSCNNAENGYVFMSGTSMATPFVAGSFALIVSRMRYVGSPSWTSIQAVNAFIKANAKDLLAPGHDPATGYGMFDMREVITKLAKDELTYV